MALYYHVSTKNHGKEKVFKPRVPYRRCPGEDATTPRICVAKTLKGCMLGIMGFHSLDQYCGMTPRQLRKGNWPWVYVLEGKAVVPTEDQLPDVDESKERWITEKTIGRRIGRISLKDLDKGKITFIPTP